MKTNEPKEYIAPVVKVVEVIVEKGFAVSAVILNNRYESIEKHVLDTEEQW